MKKIQNYECLIKIPNNVQIIKKANTLFFTGPLGLNKVSLKRIDQKGQGVLRFSKKFNILFFYSQSKSFFRSFSNLINNKIYGITRGYLVYLKIIGIGYRANLEKQTIKFKIGYSHDIIYTVPNSIRIFLIEPTLICLYGIDKNQLTQIAAKMRQLRKPSVYKGKGIRLIDEVIQLKEGKRK